MKGIKWMLFGIAWMLLGISCLLASALFGGGGLELLGGAVPSAGSNHLSPGRDNEGIEKKRPAGHSRRSFTVFRDYPIRSAISMPKVPMVKKVAINSRRNAP